MAAQPIQDPSAALARILDKNAELAALPQVIFKIMEITGSEVGSAAELEKAIVVDPAFSAKILALANSAHFALPKKVASIKDAVMFIGLRQVRQTAMAVGVFDMFLGKTDKESMRRRAWWRHSVDTALAARGIASLIPGIEENEAYTCGLLHLIGKSVLDRSNPYEFEKVMALRDKGVNPWQAEIAVFGCDHRDVAMASAQKWGFPESLVKGLAYYSRPGDPDDLGDLRAVIAMGTAIAAVSREGRSREQTADFIWETWASERLGISKEMADTFISKGMAAIAEGAHLHF